MKPELLVPVGNQEAFYAAIAGGADAIYLGLRDFNARNRAKNFTFNQFASLKKEAEKNNIKVYLTLNTIIKNSELKQLLQTLNTIDKLKPNAVIIQDWGVYYIIKKYFPNLIIHASTQMAFHNSIGATYSKQTGFERVILYRELTMEELRIIASRSITQLEVFAHGALCYSFSGYCLFSSYIGGMSANRGLCRQPCRRKYSTKSQNEYFFNLKDLQLIEHIPAILKLNVKSIKIEGRMKSAEYVYQVTRAYRMAIDNPEKIGEAKQILEMDLGRSKTQYFIGGNVSSAISDSTYAGFEIGKIENIKENGFSFDSKISLNKNDRIRIMTFSGEDSSALKLKSLKIIEDNEMKEVDKSKPNDEIYIEINRKVEKGEKIFLVGLGELRFKSKLPKNNIKFHKDNGLNKIVKMRRQTMNKSHLFVRIDNLKWMRKIYFENISGLILKLNKDDLQNFVTNRPFLKKNLHKLYIELPKFIPEKQLKFYRKELQRLHREGITNFVIGHISQKLLLPKKGVNILANENIYIMNDFAARHLQDENIKQFIYPFEISFEELDNFADRRGIVPIYFNPELFYSRMPTNIKSDELKDDKYGYKHFRSEGITKIIPNRPVAITQFKDQLFKMGYKQFLIDLSYEKPSKLLKKIFKNWNNNKAFQPSSHFNFKLGLH
ncbi:MAG: peptidase U32 family protein [Candidatus Cloacimonadota bacterium]|nr:peptidase U32 family protein [Candidatus Cloacimonadota bacterium]